MRLLLIEDDDILGDALKDFLQGDGHRVDWCRTLSAASSLCGEPFDAYLVDWQLPDGEGTTWLRTRRSSSDATPAFMLTARDLVVDKIAGLDSGADDYLVKPFPPEELAARLRALQRRLAGAHGAPIRLGPVALDVAGRQAWVHDQPVMLTGREWALMESLSLRRGGVVPKADLERLVMGMDHLVASNALEVHVSGLRRKLGPEVIETVRGVGYRLGAS